MKHSNCLVTFGGQCLEAFECYAETLGGSVEAVELQSQCPWSVEHALLRVGTWTMTGRDHIEHDALDSGAVALMLCSIEAKEALRLYNTLAMGGQTTTPTHEAKWARLAGGLVDRFGTAWIVCHGVRHSSPRLLTDAPHLSFDVLPLSQVLHDNSARTGRLLSKTVTRSSRSRRVPGAFALGTDKF